MYSLNRDKQLFPIFKTERKTCSACVHDVQIAVIWAIYQYKEGDMREIDKSIQK